MVFVANNMDEKERSYVLYDSDGAEPVYIGHEELCKKLITLSDSLDLYDCNQKFRIDMRDFGYNCLVTRIRPVAPVDIRQYYLGDNSKDFERISNLLILHEGRLVLSEGNWFDFGQKIKWTLWHYLGKLCIVHIVKNAVCCMSVDNVGVLRYLSTLSDLETDSPWEAHIEPMTKEQVRQLLMGKV